MTTDMGSSTKSRKPIMIGSGFVTAAVIAFALFSVLMTSHHVDESERYSEQYKKANLSVMFYVTTVLNGTSSEGLSYVTLNRYNALKSIEQSREAVDYFAKIHPPLRLSSAIGLVRDAADSERAFLDAAEKLFRAETESQLEDGISAVKQSSAGKTSEYGFSNSVAKFMEQLDKYTNPRYSHEGDFFIWL